MDLVNTHTHTHSTMTFNGMNGFLSSITQQQQQTVIKYNTPLYIMMYIYFVFFGSLYSQQCYIIMYGHVMNVYCGAIYGKNINGAVCIASISRGMAYCTDGCMCMFVLSENYCSLKQILFTIIIYNHFFLIFRCQLPLALLPCSTFICTMQRHNAVRHIPIHDARWRISVVYVCLCVQYAKLQNGQNMQNIWYHQHQQILLCVIHMCIYYMFGVFAVRSSKREKESDTHENISISIYLYKCEIKWHFHFYCPAIFALWKMELKYFWTKNSFFVFTRLLSCLPIPIHSRTERI